MSSMLRGAIGRQFSLCRRLCTTMSFEKISVITKQGTVVGHQSTLPNGEDYFAFKGIPYAAPPVGNLRYKQSMPLDKFSVEPLDCTEERGVSFHKDPFTGELIGGEDCLFLNVYTPKLKSEKPLPVMVWVHGGAFMMGSGNNDFYLPLYLIQEEVIVVTFNYRLGILGFLYLPDGDIPGNAGLHDQLLALKWVKENIQKFNGDPNNVTLFGQSAGAAAVDLHMISPLSKKYFHKAILQSGTSLMEWAIKKNAEDDARRLAEKMGCKESSDQGKGEFLRSTKALVDMSKLVLSTMTPDERRRGLAMPFKPVVERNSPMSIVPKSPLKALSELNAVEIPVMLGYTSKEGIAMVANAVKKLETIDNDLARMIPRNVDLDPNDSRCLQLAEEIRQFYFKGEKISKKNLSELADLMTDYHFSIGAHLTAELLSRKQHNAPLYFYRFSYDGGLNLYKKFTQLQKLKGACHGDDTFYLFHTQFTPELESQSKDEQMVKKMCRLWTNFAKHSNPTPSDERILDVQWKPVQKIGDKQEFILDYLEIDDHTRMEQGPDKGRIDFWRNVFKTWNKSFCNQSFDCTYICLDSLLWNGMVFHIF